jgi:hypothetical protein
MIVIPSSQILFGQTDSSKKSLVYWLHGVNDNDLPIWSLYNDVFSNELLMKGVKLQYSSNKPIFHLGQDALGTIDTLRSIILRTDIDVSVQPPIAICHDMGGLLVRSIEQENKRLNHSQTFRGVITISTPNQGSGFFKALKNGDVGNLVARFFSPHLETPMGLLAFRKAYQYRQARLEMFSRQAVVKNIRAKNLLPISPSPAPAMKADTVPNFIAKQMGKAIDLYLTKFYYNDNVIEEMSPYSNFLFQLNDSISSPQNTVPMINIVSSHSHQPVYRFIYSSVMNHPSLDPLDQHQDDGLVKGTQELAGIYRGLAATLQSFIFFFHNLVFSPQTMNSARETTIIGEDFIQAARSLERDFPDGASMIVGSIVKQYEVLGQKFVREAPNEDGIPIFRLVVDEKVIAKRIEGDDGIVSETAQKDPNRLPSDIRPIRNANHIGITNNRNFRLELNNNVFSDPRFRIYRKN